MPYELSVVIPSVNGMRDLRGCLQALAAQGPDVTLEMLIVDRVGDALRQEVARKFPQATLLAVAPETTIPQMRALAFDQARYDKVGVIEDHVQVGPDWAARMCVALEQTAADAVGGAIRNAAFESLAERAAFVCEYHALLPPLPAGESQGLPGNNVVYRAATLRTCRDAYQAGRWENHLHAAILARGGRLVLCPEIVVDHKMHYSFFDYLAQRFLYSRSYAGMRVAGWPWPRRIVLGGLACALPAVILVRIVRTVWNKPGMRGELLRSLPLLVPYTLAWGCGEIVGYLLGAGNSLSKVR